MLGGKRQVEMIFLLLCLLLHQVQRLVASSSPETLTSMVEVEQNEKTRQKQQPPCHLSFRVLSTNTIFSSGSCSLLSRLSHGLLAASLQQRSPTLFLARHIAPTSDRLTLARAIQSSLSEKLETASLARPGFPWRLKIQRGFTLSRELGVCFCLRKIYQLHMEFTRRGSGLESMVKIHSKDTTSKSDLYQGTNHFWWLQGK